MLQSRGRDVNVIRMKEFFVTEHVTSRGYTCRNARKGPRIKFPQLVVTNIKLDKYEKSVKHVSKIKRLQRSSSLTEFSTTPSSSSFFRVHSRGAEKSSSQQHRKISNIFKRPNIRRISSLTSISSVNYVDSLSDEQHSVFEQGRNQSLHHDVTGKDVNWMGKKKRNSSSETSNSLIHKSTKRRKLRTIVRKVTASF